MQIEKQRGLTLVELLIASTLLGLLAMGIGVFLNVCIESHQLSMRESRMGREGVLTLERIGAGLRYCDEVTSSPVTLGLSYAPGFDDTSVGNYYDGDSSKRLFPKPDASSRVTRTYTYDPDANTLTETISGNSTVLAEGVVDFSVGLDGKSHLATISLTLRDRVGKEHLFSDSVYCRNIKDTLNPERRWGTRVK